MADDEPAGRPAPNGSQPPLAAWLAGFATLIIMAGIDAAATDWHPEPRDYMLAIVAILYGPSVIRLFRGR